MEENIQLNEKIDILDFNKKVGFIMIPNVLFSNLTKLNITPYEYLLLSALYYFAHRNDSAWPSIKTLQKLTGLSHLGIRKLFNALIKKGYVIKNKRKNKEKGNISNLYSFKPLNIILERIMTEDLMQSQKDNTLSNGVTYPKQPGYPPLSNDVTYPKQPGYPPLSNDVTPKNIYIEEYKEKNNNIEEKEEEDMRNDEKRRCAIQSKNIISFNFETNELETTDELLKILESAYPESNLKLKFKEMSLWLMANPEKINDIQENSAGNFMRFVVKWLSNDKVKAKKITKKRKFQISFDPETANFTGLTEDYLNILKSKFQSIDINLEIKKMESWLLNNPSKRPASDYMRFINYWLTKAQNYNALKSTNAYSKKTWDEIRTEKNIETSKRLEEKIKAGLL